MDHTNSPRTRTTVEKVAIALILLQLAIKVTVEIRTSIDAKWSFVPVVAIMLAVAWALIILACLARKRSGFLWGGILGILHILLALPLPFLGVCNHYVMALFVSLHGLLIAIFSLWAYRSFSEEQISLRTA